MDANGFQLLLRGHQAPQDGFQISQTCRTWTIFGASNYYKDASVVNGSVVLEVDQDLGLQMHLYRSDYAQK